MENKKEIIDNVYKKGFMYQGCLMACYSKPIFTRKYVYDLVKHNHIISSTEKQRKSTVYSLIDRLMTEKKFVEIVSDKVPKKYKITTLGLNHLRKTFPEETNAMARFRVPFTVIPLVQIKDTTSPMDKQIRGNHYKQLAIQPIEYIDKNNLSYNVGNVIKYVTRYRSKGGINDLRKAKHFLEIIAELDYGKKL